MSAEPATGTRLSTDDAETYTGLSRQTLAKLRVYGGGPRFIKVGRRVIYDLNKAEATAETLDEDGWLHTGDIGYADAEGRCYLVDRLKELIKYKGYQVAPAELEALLLSHPNVAAAGVIPIPDEEAGEVPKAFVVPNGEIEVADLQAFVAERVAPYKKIREIEFVETLPKSPAGKLLRRVLKAQI